MNKTHAALCNWTRELALAILRREGIDTELYEYTWDGEWFAFKYGLGGDVTASDESPERAIANAHGLRLRQLCSPYHQEVLDDLSYASPGGPDCPLEDDYDCLRARWGVLTEVASDLCVPIPPEVERIVRDNLDPPSSGGH